MSSCFIVQIGKLRLLGVKWLPYSYRASKEQTLDVSLTSSGMIFFAQRLPAHSPQTLRASGYRV